jgi:hypothetical protein
MVHYQNEQGDAVMISADIAQGVWRWAAYRQPSDSVHLQRVHSLFLPLRQSAEMAQADLDAFARRKRWKPITGGLKV